VKCRLLIINRAVNIECWQVNAGRKHIGSTDAMRVSVRTSELLRHRAENIVPGVMDDMRDAILNRNFDKFAELTMKVCNGSHLIMHRTNGHYRTPNPSPLVR